MGDGRYYSTHQFCTIIFLTILIIFLIISTMLSVYRNFGSKDSKYVLSIYILSGALLFLRFVEEVIISEYIAYIIKNIESMIFLVINYMLLGYLLRYVISNYYKITKKFIQLVNIFSCMFFSILLLMSLLNSKFIIKEYSFFSIRFGIGYMILLYVAFWLILISTSFIFLRKPDKDFDTKLFNNKKFSIAIFIFWIIPLSIYILGILLHSYNIIELFMYLLFLIGFNLIANYLRPYRITSSIFYNVKDLILDYVFIIDINGSVIHKNNSAELSEVFQNVKKIDVDNLEPLFKKKIMIRSSYNKKFIKYLDEGSNKYFSYNIKNLKNKDEIVGSIITFIDITKLIKMLDNLKKQQSDTEKINEKLYHYSKIVYRLEKEKEINMLLDQIAVNQEKSMHELRNHIQELIQEQDKEKFALDIEHIILDAKKDLADVRSAVSAYMQYYGG
ncbi:hypothetical protein SH2C18_23930 [Clostridium sediminicola]|uniref:hypothetical protein n=1 Tax=Clostridium sediminicola TaxID=3114879 RepID=UPI0031F24FC3